ncbi:MAG TPA: STAS domain-containing protein [Polyangiaceae bacterium]|jgi:anti-anti-sigma regulatory factor|nr:STAS domain-containing protein [Polyangiaceae bacterium]
MPDYPPLSAVSVTSFLEDVPEIAFIYRDDGLLMAMNAVCERFVGVPREAVVGRFNMFEDQQVVPSVLIQGYRAAFRGEPQVIPAGELNLARSSEPSVQATKATMWVDTIIVPLQRREDGSAAYVLAIQRDVTELVRARREIEEAQQKISQQRDVIESLEAARREIEAQRATIQVLSTPVIEVWDGIVTLPLLGHFNAERVSAVTSQLLEAVVRTRARYAILDLTGIASIDATTGDHILQIVGAVGLLGTTGVLVGIQPGIAQTLVGLGVELSRVRVYQNLQQALKACMREQGPA